MYFLILLHLGCVAALTGYDCDKSLSDNIYQLQGSDSCESIVLAPSSSFETPGTIIKIPPLVRFGGFMCIHQTITIRLWCTFDLSPQTSLDPLNYLGFQSQPILPEECAHWVKYRRTSPLLYSVGLMLGITEIYYEDDITDKSYFCRHWSGAETQVVHQFLIQETTITAILNHQGHITSYRDEDDSLIFVTSSYGGHSLDKTQFHWHSSTIPSCVYDVILTDTFTHSLSMHQKRYMVSNTRWIGFQLLKKTRVCQHEVYRTKEAHIFISYPTVLFPLNYTLQFPLDMVGTLISSQQYNAIALHNAQEFLSRRINEHSCLLETNLRRIIILNTQTSPATLGYSLTGKYGVEAVISGETIQLRKCQEVEVRIQEQSKCYTRIPIKRHSSQILEFLDAATKVIHMSATQIACDDPVVPMFKSRMKWYTMTPALHAIPNPPLLPQLLMPIIINETDRFGLLYDEDYLRRLEQTPRYTQRADTIGHVLTHFVDSSFPVHGQLPSSITTFDFLTGTAWKHWFSTGIIYIWLILLTGLYLWLFIKNKQHRTQTNSVSVHLSESIAPLGLQKASHSV